MRAGGIAGVLLTACLAGCSATHLVYVYDVSVGMDVAYSTEGSGRVVFGYDRGTYAVVPQKQAARSCRWPP